eukprot:CAMPEP_0173347932 /NCGR_PEP_ID=MMETSP1144-20121109/13435_1 /TAXON_ID=483371 /ORGANISM="non described non described, Strain CCMP2298" /LENGTH=152 /DNA_ID=CAMNT_0014295487 /DNA_START=452 /DNA_END=907 /DNA_ORIENTATION=-
MQPFLCGAARSHPTNNAYSNGTDAFSAGTDGTVAASAPHCVSFFAVGDFGNPTAALKKTAKAMGNWADKYGKPDFILGCGDNFYPYGVHDVTDPQFQASWYDIFLKYEGLRVPWKFVLGNHDYMGNPQAQVDFHYNRRNVGGFFNMPGRNYR